MLQVRNGIGSYLSEMVKVKAGPVALGHSGSTLYRQKSEETLLVPKNLC